MKPMYGDLETWIREELAQLWGELRQEHQWTIGNDGIAQRDRPWSNACEGIAERIKTASALVGPIDPEAISMPDIADGWFSWANRKVGVVDAVLPSKELMAACVKYVTDQRRSARRVG